MTMLTHTGNRFEPISHSSRRKAAATPDGAHLTVFKRFCVCAVVVLLTGGAVAGLIALKTVIALSRISY